MIAVSGELVMGGVVLGSDRGKQVVAQLRSLLGGEVRSFQKILVRARREARLRMLEEARRIGADCVVNVRFETSDDDPWLNALLVEADGEGRASAVEQLLMPARL